MLLLTLAFLMPLGDLPKVLASSTRLLSSPTPPQHSKHNERGGGGAISFARSVLSNVISIFAPMSTEGNSQYQSPFSQLCEDYFLFLLQIIRAFYKSLLHHCDLLRVEWQQIVFQEVGATLWFSAEFQVYRCTQPTDLIQA